ncbi:hypothetical protein FOCC_FOCC012224 [Frankliniella occidentalis]|nr:hypothetical protein FOCC_FOCC012224 [Frankliniella occidentalis]
MSLSKQGGSSTPGGAPPGKKRKIDSENRSFQQRWEYEYFFVVVDEKLTCLVCNTVIAVRKEFNLKRHYSTHSEQFKNLSAPQRVAKLEELKEARASSNAKTTSAPNRLMTWVAELAFLVDVTGHLNNLNLKLQGKGHVISDMLQAVQGFEMRLTLFEEQLRKGELFHFESLKSLSSSELDLIKFANIVKKLRIEFADNFKDVRKMQTEISLMTVPFTMPLPKVPLPLQNEVIDLRCDKVLESRFPTMKLVEFCTLLSAERFPQLKGLYRKMLALFGSTYVCEEFFSLMKIVKNRFRSRLTDEHLTAQLRVMARNIGRF